MTLSGGATLSLKYVFVTQTQERFVQVYVIALCHMPWFQYILRILTIRFTVNSGNAMDV